MMILGDEHKDRGPVSDGVLSGHVDDWEEPAVDYLDGVLDPQSRAAVEAHLRDCPACTARLQTQERLVAFLEDIDYVEPPAQLEDRVLDAIVSPLPSEPEAERAPGSVAPSRWETFWRRKIVPWVPATVGVVAVLAGIIAFGVARDGVQEATVTTAASAVALTASEKTPDAATTAAPMAAPPGGEGSAALGSATQESANAPSTTAGAAVTITEAPTETTAGTLVVEDADTTETTAVTVAAAAGPDDVDADTVQDAETMVAGLKAAAEPVCFALKPPGSSSESDGGTNAGDSYDRAGTAMAQQLTAVTGLEPLDDSLWIDGPTFAAYVPRDQAKQLVELLVSIGASFQYGVMLTPHSQATYAGGQGSAPDGVDAFARLLEKKAEFVELSAYRTPAPAVTNWSYTTSTLVATGQAGQETPARLPDELGTHVLVVIYLDR
ncbi:MAG: zf-HC2 domain-containing protein [Thermoleophilia bacterium]|nr:zf-HC2 domain-containing protein [Thermoleophilia bacterium]